jgi:hypothetical protein
MYAMNRPGQNFGGVFMGKIDDPAEKLREHYLERSYKPDTLALGATSALLRNFPHVGWVLGKVMDFIKSKEKDEKLYSFNNQLVDLYQGLGKDYEDLEVIPKPVDK